TPVIAVSRSSLIAPFLVRPLVSPWIYTLSLHDALPISASGRAASVRSSDRRRRADETDGDDRIECRRGLARRSHDWDGALVQQRSEEHTSELQSPYDLVCRLLLEKKNRCVV